ncbi:hypothetical protein F511_29292 [Dorcoceras hygrometricum]|uniref:Uncharacterized protein n=1 Tax=Dorcoceras hygrometricum TaxID=472368 RepID=A0A2Z7B672_9LAMI|nr:hypothetical protein F511_29292 [Dorcoceras hygrometricum]
MRRAAHSAPSRDSLSLVRPWFGLGPVRLGTTGPRGGATGGALAMVAGAWRTIDGSRGCHTKPKELNDLWQVYDEGMRDTGPVELLFMYYELMDPLFTTCWYQSGGSGGVESENLRQFTDGLRPDIRHDVNMVDVDTYMATVNMAYRYERGRKDMRDDFERKHQMQQPVRGQSSQQPGKRPF